MCCREIFGHQCAPVKGCIAFATFSFSGLGKSFMSRMKVESKRLTAFEAISGTAPSNIP